jgi:acetyl-CoA C-acetyltransferase
VPLARVVAGAVVGVPPAVMGTGPVAATAKLLRRLSIDLGAIDVVELNEAFAAQTLACVDELGLDATKVNVRGGALALGHPLGASGVRIVTTLVHAMRDRGDRLGLATMCIGLGQGIALIVERIGT